MANRPDCQIMSALQNSPGAGKLFDFRDLEKATDGFSNEQKLGEGPSWVVYRGVLPEEANVEVVVKKYTVDNIEKKDDFLSELIDFHRKHLVTFLGWCLENGMLLMVYEFKANSSLSDYLLSREEKDVARRKIMSDLVDSLKFVHLQRKVTVYGDLKPSNILLNSVSDTRLADFGKTQAPEYGQTSRTGKAAVVRRRKNRRK